MTGKLVTIATYHQAMEAHVAKTKLASAGIDAFLADEHIASMDWHYSNVVGGIKLKVEESEAERAAKVLGLEAAGFYSEEESGPACIVCNSPDVRTHGILSLLAIVFPLPFLKRKWECGRCGHRWEENT
jgi:hypothetical protein